MPKIIENIEDKIFEAAKELFNEKGYNSVDMKGIAKRCGIAVGTLYNYHNSKEELYYKIVEQSWKVTFIKLDKAVNGKDSKEDILYKIISVLYEDIMERRGIGEDLRNDIKSSELNRSFENSLIENFEKILKKVYTDKDKKGLNKIIYILLCNTVVLVKLYEVDKKENIDTIYKMISTLL